jgi:hypothetical protein
MAKVVRLYLVLGILIAAGFSIGAVLDMISDEQAISLSTKTAMVWGIMFAATIGLKLVSKKQ